MHQTCKFDYCSVLSRSGRRLGHTEWSARELWCGKRREWGADGADVGEILGQGNGVRGHVSPLHI